MNRFIGVLLIAVALASPLSVRADGEPVTSDELIAEISADPALAKYPRFRDHLFAILRVKEAETGPLNVNPYVAELLGGNGRPAVEIRADDVREFFEAAADDELTIIRAMVFVATLAHRADVVIYMDGRHAREAVEDARLDLGLAVPLNHLVLFAYMPITGPDAEPGALCRFIALYGDSFEHRFRKEVLNATLKVGTGRTAPFLNPWVEDAEIETVYVVEGNLVSNEAGFGYTDVGGIGGKKHGVMGFLQKMFFFLPDAIDDMVVRDGNLYVNALLDQTVENFETSRRYTVRHVDGVFANPESP